MKTRYILFSTLPGAIRRLKMETGTTIISLSCLVVGIVSFVLLAIYARYELSYDSIFPEKDNIYLLGQVLLDSESVGDEYYGSTSGIVAPTLVKEFQEVEYSARAKDIKAPFIYKQKSFVAEGLYADKDFLKIFPFKLVTGDYEKALEDPYSIVLTESLAIKIFGSEDPMGKVLTGRGGELYNVTAIMEDLPGNTHFKFDYLVSFLTMYSVRDDIDSSWGIMNYASYIKLYKNVSALDFEGKLPAIINKYHDTRYSNRRYFLIPLEDIHFSTGIKMPEIETRDKNSVFIIALVGILILVVACINYINLQTATADSKSRGVAVRKICGATRINIIKQFMAESFSLAFISVAVSMLIIRAVFPLYIKMVGINIPLDYIFSLKNIFAFILLSIVLGFLAGGYPSFILSSFLPLNILKGSKDPSTRYGHLKSRNLLTIFQFGVSIALVVVAVSIQKQLLFIQNKDVGYNRDNIVVIRIWNQEIRDNFQTIKSELLNDPLFSAVSFAGTTPIRMTERNGISIRPENGEALSIPMVTTYFIDNDYLDLFRIKLAAGRNFSLNQPLELSNQVIINETLSRMLGLEDPVGKSIYKWGAEHEIIAVAKDFNFTSMKSTIEPLIFSYNPERSRIALIKLASNDFNSSIGKIESVFKKFDANFVLDYSFMDDQYNNLYVEETTMGRVVLSFSIIATLIAIIGIYGLVSFAVSRMTKTIGVRKAMGASILSVTGEILKRFFAPVFLSIIIFLPIGWYISFSWLKDFSYRTSLGAGQLIFSVLIVVLASLFAIIHKTLKAAYVNPADSLRCS